MSGSVICGGEPRNNDGIHEAEVLNDEINEQNRDGIIPKGDEEGHGETEPKSIIGMLPGNRDAPRQQEADIAQREGNFSQPDATRN